MKPPRQDVTSPGPLWSVMLPVYNPGPLFRDTLEAVLAQADDPEQFQIAVVDDRSPDVDVAALVRDVAGDRVAFHQNEKNLGLAGNWNRCIELSRGRWVHILHQDDLILPDFYRNMARADAAGPDVGMAFCRHAFIDETGAVTTLSDEERPSAGVLEDWLFRLAEIQRIQCPSAVVRRTVYEAVGGFSPEFCFTLDWEMWARIARRYAVWYEPRVLAQYRIHPGSETARLSKLGLTVNDTYRTARRIASYLPREQRRTAWHRARRHAVNPLLHQAAISMNAGDRRGGMKTFRRALWLDPSLLRSRIAWDYFVWNAKLLVGMGPRAHA